MTMDWNFRIGDLVVVLAFLAYVFKAGTLAESIKIMQVEIAALKDAMKVVASAMTTLAVQKTQIERVEKDITEMKHGRGFIIGREGRGAMNDVEF